MCCHWLIHVSAAVCRAFPHFRERMNEGGGRQAALKPRIGHGTIGDMLRETNKTPRSVMQVMSVGSRKLLPRLSIPELGLVTCFACHVLRITNTRNALDTSIISLQT